VNGKAIVHALYKKLLALYPRAFRERLGESMQQTFNDLCKDSRTGSSWLGFVLWTFTETGLGIFREYVLLTVEGAAMKSLLAKPGFAPVISFALCVFPFMILEWATRSDAPRSDASLMLWVVLWFLSTGFFAVFMVIMRGVRAGNRMLTHPLSISLGVILFAALAWMWGALVVDQMPCFLGGSGC
jgi:hypothetical protein